MEVKKNEGKRGCLKYNERELDENSKTGGRTIEFL